MSPIVAAVVRSAVVPAVVATVLLFLTGGLKEDLRAKLQSLILALAFACGSYMLIERLAFPPGDVSETFSYLALILAVFVFVSPKEVNKRYALRALFVLFCGAVLLWPLRQSLGNPVSLRNCLAFFCLALGVWSIVERNSRTVGLPALIALPMISAIALSILLLLSASASFSQMVGIVAALLGGTLVLALFKPNRVSVPGLLPFFSVFIILFMVAGHFYLDINPWHMVYMCWPFAVLWIRGWLPLPKHRIVEALGLSVLAILPLAYFLFNLFKTAGPLY